jgi:hypothetical protein
VADHATRARDIQKRHAAAVQQVQERRDLSAEGRKRQLARVHTQFSAEMDQVRAAANEATEQRRNEIVRGLFGNPSPGDSTSVISYRDALDRADRVKTPEEAARLLRRAQQTGDTTLARAVAAKALDAAMGPDANGAWAGVVNTWGAEDAGRDELLTELSALNDAASPAGRFAGGLQYALARPLGLDAGDNVAALAAAADQIPGEEHAPFVYPDGRRSTSSWGS